MQQCTELNATNRSKAYPDRYENVGKCWKKTDGITEGRYGTDKIFLCSVLREQSQYTKDIGLVAQLVRAPPCHGGGRRFESDRGRLGS